jgi:hypothetical protein
MHIYPRIRIRIQNWGLNVFYTLRKSIPPEASRDMSAERKSSVAVVLISLDFVLLQYLKCSDPPEAVLLVLFTWLNVKLQLITFCLPDQPRGLVVRVSDY